MKSKHHCMARFIYYSPAAFLLSSYEAPETAINAAGLLRDICSTDDESWWKINLNLVRHVNKRKKAHYRHPIAVNSHMPVEHKIEASICGNTQHTATHMPLTLARTYQ